MRQCDPGIEDATFETVSEPASARHLDPQVALWLARVFLSVTLVATAILFLRGADQPPPMQRTALARVPFDAQTDKIPERPRFEVPSAVEPADKPVEGTPAQHREASAGRLAPAAARPSSEAPSGIRGEPSIVPQHSGRRARQARQTLRAPRSTPQPLAAIARGANRGVRTLTRFVFGGLR